MKRHTVVNASQTILPVFPLWLLLILPSAMLIALTAGLAGYIGFVNGRKTVNNFVSQLRNDASEQIEDHVRTFLAIPHEINQLNTESFQQGWINVNDTEMVQNYFLTQVRSHDTITSIYFGNPDGGIIGSGREGKDESYYVYSTVGLKSGVFNKYAITNSGEIGELLTSIPSFDTRTRPWYSGAIQKSEATWSDIYILFTGQDMALSASLPVYDARHKLLGVASVDIFLSQIEDFLETMKISPSGQSFIMERSGLLVSTSTGEQPFKQTNQGLERLHVSELQTPIVKHAAEFLRRRFGENYDISRKEQLKFEIGQETYFLDVTPVQDEYGIDWLVVVIIPESDFMAEINDANRSTSLIAIALLIISIFVSIFTAKKIASRISKVNDAARSFAMDAERTSGLGGSRIREINELTVSFTKMESRLRQTLDELKSEVGERKLAEKELEAVNNELLKSLEREQMLARTDGMTGLYNYRYFFEHAAHEFHVATRYNHPLTILMFDVDHFKQINDMFGHAAGDQVLAQVSQILTTQVRAADMLARYGGDEFIILLPQTDTQHAFLLAERIRSDVAAAQLDIEQGQISVTLSIGMSELQHEPLDKNIEQIIKRADQALYAAKNGRNRTVKLDSQNYN
jgi:diguanylate cyclase (GGDEF)-like protein